MSSSTMTKHFVDSALARIIGLLLALAIAFLLWSNWGGDFSALFAGDKNDPVMVSASEPAKPANPALQSCLVQRVGDVKKMKADGILSDAQFAAFKSRAESLCRAQNPG